jgi:hypothetical protein
MERAYRAGETVEDLCRACKAPRDHTVIVVDAGGRPLRVQCGFCDSQHNYRGGGERAPVRAAPLPVVSEKERIAPPMSSDARTTDLEMLLRRILREEMGLTPVPIAEKWRDGQLVLKPGNPALQEKAWPISSFFHKVVMLRNRLRTLEQQLNASELPDEQKVKMQSYITGCYGTLTSFNVLFAAEDDQFRGAGGD